ncbi:hypothetical protein [Romboutsia sp. 1001713B170131_170501_G6]|uniref:hypothetical protein n=1 Tax=Romboutsia sp. 1001713B170131_170501_G6 TaxID=2787108 RepID=UPI0018AAFB33|nr:hypothetical protein [Romboutsia sp. 1001713B170131_170501_G6]
MFILRYMNEDDDLSVKEFTNLSEVKSYISENSLERTWHQIEEIKKVIPNLKED